MDNDLRKQIYNQLNAKETEDLLEIWYKRDTQEWQAQTFEIIEQILKERLGQAPSWPTDADETQLFNQVDRYLNTGDLIQALRECELAIQIASDLATAYSYRGMIYDEMGEAEKALADYREALRLDPNLEDASDNFIILEQDIEEDFHKSPAKRHLDQALAYAGDGETERALHECELARSGLPRIALAYNYLGLIHEEMGRLEAAIEAYREAIQLNPRFYAARENMANAKVKLEEERYRQAGFDDWGVTYANESWNDIENKLIEDTQENQDMEMAEAVDPIPGWMYLNEKSYVLSGWPGHRIRPGRSGYDPLDYYFEHAHMQGVLIRLLLTRKLRTHNPMYLLLMSFVGISFCLPVLFIFGTTPQKLITSIISLLFYSPYIVVGVAMLVNIVQSFLTNKPDSYEENGSAFF